MDRPFFHDVLGTGTGCHPCHFGTDTLPDDRVSKRPASNCAGMDFYDLMAAGTGNRRLSFNHELALHEHLSPISIFMPVKELPGHNTTEVFDLIHITINSLLQYLVDDF